MRRVGGGENEVLPMFLREEEEEVERLDQEWVFLERGFKEEHADLGGKRRSRRLVRGSLRWIARKST